MVITCVVTGCAGFIGSHLTEKLLAKGYRVLGIDGFTEYYSREIKQRNIRLFRNHPNFELIQKNIVDVDCSALLQKADYLFHQAAQAGVRSSWGSTFQNYTRDNIDATQLLLEAARTAPRLRRFVFASTSSIYGNAETYPTGEHLPPRPVSPYGITKLAAEQLGQLYHTNFGVPFVALRYFTVFGPRQRPDMGFHKFMRAVLEGRPIEVFGDGLQTRDFTYVADIVEANLQAALADDAVHGKVINIGGGSRVVLNEVLDLIGQLARLPVRKLHGSCQAGDARHTAADITRAQDLLGYAPRFDLERGLQQQLLWLRESEILPAGRGAELQSDLARSL